MSLRERYFRRKDVENRHFQLAIPEGRAKLQTIVHDLRRYLHGVAGTRGEKSREFKLEINRDIKLENKYIDGLKDEYNVVAKWWTEKHKSMVQIDDGSWVLADHEKDEEDEDDR